MHVHHVGFRIKGFYRLAQFGPRWEMTPNEAQHRLTILQFFARYGQAATGEAFGVSRRTLYRWQQTFTQTDGQPAALAAPPAHPAVAASRCGPLHCSRRFDPCARPTPTSARPSCMSCCAPGVRSSISPCPGSPPSDASSPGRPTRCGTPPSAWTPAVAPNPWPGPAKPAHPRVSDMGHSRCSPAIPWCASKPASAATYSPSSTRTPASPSPLPPPPRLAAKRPSRWTPCAISCRNPHASCSPTTAQSFWATSSSAWRNAASRTGGRTPARRK